MRLPAASLHLRNGFATCGSRSRSSGWDVGFNPREVSVTIFGNVWLASWTIGIRSCFTTRLPRDCSQRNVVPKMERRLPLMPHVIGSLSRISCCGERKSWTRPLSPTNNRQLRTEVFRCATETCAACPVRPPCSPRSKTGRTITRTEHEELVEALRARMETPAGKALYKLRGQTIEQPFADAKEHRGLRRFCRRGLNLAQAQTGAWVLGRNLLALHHLESGPSPHVPTSRTLQKMRCLRRTDSVPTLP